VVQQTACDLGSLQSRFCSKYLNSGMALAQNQVQNDDTLAQSAAFFEFPVLQP